MTRPELHTTIAASISLAARIASRHPGTRPCQLDRPCRYGVPEAQIEAVVEIPRHTHDGASRRPDAAFDHEAAPTGTPAPGGIPLASSGGRCSSTPAGHPCH